MASIINKIDPTISKQPYPKPVIKHDGCRDLRQEGGEKLLDRGKEAMWQRAKAKKGNAR